MNNIISSNTYILGESTFSRPVQYAINALKRDIQNTCLITDNKGITIVLKGVTDIDPDCFVIRLKDNDDDGSGKCLEISASDDFGFIYGIYHVSKMILGVNEFWFWNEQKFIKRNGYEVPEGYHIESRPFSVRFRGWFINDEVLIDAWNPNGDKELPWKMAFEALLRCGGNMTIPGTDENAHIYDQIASDMGLWITHHHAEPLGAQMFSRVYPDLDASYDKYPELFEQLWKDAVDRQKDYKVIWNLGFRGQGDRPFWADDPAYNTDEKRGELISKLIRRQYDIVKSFDDNAIFCSNLYGETMELYKKGLIQIPDDVVFIWADNGYGKMVSRRQGNHNPRVSALPEGKAKGRHGIYYHASFYDLQAAAQMTMLPNSPEFVVKELLNVYDKGADDFWIINCSNIKPHTYYLDLIAKLWVENETAKNLDAFVDDFSTHFCKRYICEASATEVSDLYRAWSSYCPKYGANEDDHAGEQFAQHGARVLMSALITGYNCENPQNTKAATEWLWFSDKKSLIEQVEDYKKNVAPTVAGYKEYLDKCNKLLNSLPGDSQKIFEDIFIWQVEYHYYGYLGALHICNAIENVLKTKPDFLSAFKEAGEAAEAFRTGYEKMRSYESGIFEGFFDNDCEADIRQTYYASKGLMSFLRFHGDGPHFYEWQRMFQQGAGGNKVHLILRTKKHLTDDELWKLMNLRL